MAAKLDLSPEDKLELIRTILSEVSRGSLVVSTCKKYGISRETLHAWTSSDPALSDAYARARVMQAHAMAEDTIVLADSATGGKEGDVDKVRLQVDTRKWLTGKIAPRLYGEKLELSGDPERPLQVNVWQFGEKKVEF